MNRRSMLLWSSLAAAIAASVWAIVAPAGDASESEAPRTPTPLALAAETARPPEQPSRASTARSAPLVDAQTPGTERQGSPARDDIFAAYSWQPPRPVAAAIKEPTQAPPVPFKFAGRLEAEGPPSYILAEGARMHVVAVGGQVGEFRLQEAGADALVFLHVPSNLTTTLSVAP